MDWHSCDLNSNGVVKLGLAVICFVMARFGAALLSSGLVLKHSVLKGIGEVKCGYTEKRFAMAMRSNV